MTGLALPPFIRWTRRAICCVIVVHVREISGWARTPGENQLVFIVERARAGTARMTWAGLAQPGAARRADGVGLAAVLESVGFSARGTRSNISTDDQQESFMKVLRYQVSDGAAYGMIH